MFHHQLICGQQDIVAMLSKYGLHTGCDCTLSIKRLIIDKELEPWYKSTMSSNTLFSSAALHVLGRGNTFSMRDQCIDFSFCSKPSHPHLWPGIQRTPYIVPLHLLMEVCKLDAVSTLESKIKAQGEILNDSFSWLNYILYYSWPNISKHCILWSWE